MEISNLRKDIIDIKNLLKLPKKISNPNDIVLMELISDQIIASSNINNNTVNIYKEAKEIKELFVNLKNSIQNKHSVFVEKLSSIDNKTDNLANLVSLFELPEELKDCTISAMLADLTRCVDDIQYNTDTISINNTRYHEIFNGYLNTINTNTSHLSHIRTMNENISTKITNIQENFKLPDEAEFNFATILILTIENINKIISNIYNYLNNDNRIQLRSLANALISIDARLQEKLTPMLTALNQIVTNTSK